MEPTQTKAEVKAAKAEAIADAKEAAAEAKADAKEAAAHAADLPPQPIPLKPVAKPTVDPLPTIAQLRDLGWLISERHQREDGHIVWRMWRVNQPHPALHGDGETDAEALAMVAQQEKDYQGPRD